MSRLSGIVLVMGLLAGLALAQDEPVKKKAPTRRFGYDVDETTYPQKTYQEALKSVAVALDRKKTEYMLAQLIDPQYVDYWIDRFKAEVPQGREDAKTLLAFDLLVAKTNRYLLDDPLLLRDLRRFAREAEWTDNENVAVGTVKSIPARKVFLRRIGDRWFLENRQQEK
jgi:hypothetical protein